MLMGGSGVLQCAACQEEILLCPSSNTSAWSGACLLLNAPSRKGTHICMAPQHPQL